MRKEKMREFSRKVSESMENVNEKLKGVRSDIASITELQALKEEELNFVEEYEATLGITLSKLRSCLVNLKVLEDVLVGSKEASQEMLNSLAEREAKVAKEDKVVAEVEARVESLSKAEKAEIPKMKLNLQSYSDVRKMSDTLVAESTKEPLKEEHTPVFIGKSEMTQTSEDLVHRGHVLSCYLHPVETDEGYEVWLRRAMITHYLQSGITVTKKLVDRYNNFAELAKMKPTTVSAVSKDVVKILNKEFTMVGMGGTVGTQVFNPSMILNAMEKSRLDSLLEEQRGKNPNYESFIKTHIMREFSDMTKTKEKAVYYYLKIKEN